MIGRDGKGEVTMRVLILSDIHANLAALEAVIADAARYGYDAVWCLGDIVGYGPEPDQAVALVRALNPISVVGNHDWAVLGRMEVKDFNPEASRAVLWTRDQLSPESMAWLGELPSQPLLWGDFTLTHGSPRDPVWEYVHSPSVAQHNFEHFDTRFLPGRAYPCARVIYPARRWRSRTRSDAHAGNRDDVG